MSLSEIILSTIIGPESTPFIGQYCYCSILGKDTLPIPYYFDSEMDREKNKEKLISVFRSQIVHKPDWLLWEGQKINPYYARVAVSGLEIVKILNTFRNNALRRDSFYHRIVEFEKIEMEKK